MAGHSKWANTKHRKAAQDAKKNKIFSNIAKEITIAAKSGGDPDANPRLRTCIQKAKQANMPNDRINSAIKKGTGEDGGAVYEELVYEGYVNGIGIIVEVTTDNKNRSASDVRSTLTKAGGELAKPGALAFSFARKGQFLIAAENGVTEDSLMEIAIEAGAEDVKNNGDHFEVLCEPNDYDTVSAALTDANIACESSEIAYIPNNLVAVDEPEVAKRLIKLEDKLDEIDDVKAVWLNADIAESLVDA